MKISQLEEVCKYNLDGKIIKYHMPGNYGGKGLNKGFKDNIHLYETTEVIGMDDYHDPSGIIKKAEKKAAQLFSSIYSIYLVNGSTSGMIAAILYMFKEGDKVIIPRDSHKSVIYGLVLSGAEPVLLENDYSEKLGIYTPPSYEKIRTVTDNNPKVKGIVLTTPNYYGVGLKELSKTVEYCTRREIKLIVDEAHGSHLYFTELKKHLASSNNVPLVVNSTHKNMRGMTQTGILNINSPKINSDDLRKHISMMTSTSPSYPLLASISYTIEDYSREGLKILANTTKKAEYMKELLDKYKIRYIREKDLGTDSFLDPTKVTILLDNRTIANKVYKQLIKHKIMPEMISDKKIILMLNENISFKEIKKTVLILKRVYFSINTKIDDTPTQFNFKLKQVITPRQAFYSLKETVPYKESIGRIATESITPYPPGIPIVLPGQMIEKEVIDYLKDNSSSVHGVNNGMIEVVK